MESVLEEQRSLHEERERLVDTITREWMQEKKTHKGRINSEHRIKLLMDRYITSTNRLQALYTTNKLERDNEIRTIGGPNEFAEFYSRLKNLKELHKRTSVEQAAVSLSVEFNEINMLIEDPNRADTDLVVFTDEEGYGKYLDLNAIFQQYINLKGVRRVDYVSWLTIFDRLYEMPKETKRTADYRRYLNSFIVYFVDFIKRTRPLTDLAAEREKCDTDFEAVWSKNRFIGWTKDTEQQQHGALKHTASAHIDLSPYNSAAELQVLGLERLKNALTALGLKCGGTLQERAQRLYATKGRRLDTLDAAMFATKKPATEDDTDTKQRELALMEAQVYHYAEMLSEERVATRDNVQRKQARNVGEVDDEEVEEITQIEIEDTSSDIPYNPKNLPLGWDGKPIPYWLYKLHGLNISYPCEICGNQVYKGPKTFQRHFSEWRHSHGMRCLGIPNTAHFANITKIIDAVELWKKLSAVKETERFKPEQDEEYEDSAGNVVTKRIFEDLKRQGLL